MVMQLSEMTLEQLVALIDERIDKCLTEFWKELRKLDEINQAQIEALVDEVECVGQKLAEILADPDEGLEVREEIVEKLKVQRKSRKKRIPTEEVT